MDDEIEDIIGILKYTDSQKSITTSAEYSLDFTDSSPERHNSSGKETYIIEYDDSDDSEKTFQIRKNESILNLHEVTSRSIIAKQDMNHQHKHVWAKDQAVSFNLQNCLFPQESFTQTSKTIIELVQNEIHRSAESNTLETQTSFISITENKIVEFRLQKVGALSGQSENEHKKCYNNVNDTHNKMYASNFHNTPVSRCHKQITFEDLKGAANFKKDINQFDVENEVHSESSDMIRFIDDESKESEDHRETSCEKTSENDTSKCDSDIEEDSLMENEYRENRDNLSDMSDISKSIDNDLEELYNKLTESPLLMSPASSNEPYSRKVHILAPLKEETIQKGGNIVDAQSSETLVDPTTVSDSETLFINNAGVKIKMLANNNKFTREKDKFKLPPLKNNSCPNSPNLNFLFAVNTSSKPPSRSGNLPCLREAQNDLLLDRWELNTKDLASGESPHISRRNVVNPVTLKKPIHLPPIHVEGVIVNKINDEINYVTTNVNKASTEIPFDAISIKGRIKELRMMNASRFRSRNDSRSCSPTSVCSRDENRSCTVAEKGCDNLCAELLRRLRSSSWIEITETLEDIPVSLEKLWSTITENRIADLLRQVIVHIESPRTQVARSACNTLAEILKNTNYTKKPDFYEGISMLLTKTGSFSRPVRRAANVALDTIVCHVDITPAVTAVCVYGVGHKSGLVRSAAARLLVVCCALAERGRLILRARPTSAVTARQHVLRALADMLHDKSTETRKYAERLYAMLRPLPTFEAYFLTDVNVEVAARHLKRFDQILLKEKQDR